VKERAGVKRKKKNARDCLCFVFIFEKKKWVRTFGVKVMEKKGYADKPIVASLLVLMKKKEKFTFKILQKELFLLN
jgi:hypothetical protein